MTTNFLHDSELPAELCFDPSCEDHNPPCAWNLADGSECSDRGINRIGGRAWCAAHTDLLNEQIASLRDAVDKPR